MKNIYIKILKLKIVKLEMYWSKMKTFKMHYKNTNISRKYKNRNLPITTALNKKENCKMPKI